MILLVEDEPGMAFLEREVLERAGFPVEDVGRGDLAIEALEDGRQIALIVLDYMLPDMTGAEVLVELGERIAVLPVVVVTGYPDPEIEQRMRSAGVFDYLIKDMELEFLDRLPHVVKNAIDFTADKN